jgi:hypothetical protein
MGMMVTPVIPVTREAKTGRIETLDKPCKKISVTPFLPICWACACDPSNATGIGRKIPVHFYLVYKYLINVL